MFIALGINQLGLDSHVVTDPLYRALDNRPDAELLPDLPQVLRRLPVFHHRGTGDDSQCPDICEPGQQVVVDTIGEQLILRVRASTRERQHGDRYAFFRDHRSRRRLLVSISHASDVQRDGYAQRDYQ